jgi:hypothetical protein
MAQSRFPTVGWFPECVFRWIEEKLLTAVRSFLSHSEKFWISSIEDEYKRLEQKRTFVIVQMRCK